MFFSPSALRVKAGLSSSPNKENPEVNAVREKPVVIEKDVGVSELVLKKFTEVPWVNLGENVVVGVGKSVGISVVNPGETTTGFVIEKIPEGLAVEGELRREVPAGGKVELVVKWTPTERGSARYTMTVLWDKRYRLQVVLFGKAVGKKEPSSGAALKEIKPAAVAQKENKPAAPAGAAVPKKTLALKPVASAKTDENTTVLTSARAHHANASSLTAAAAAAAAEKKDASWFLQKEEEGMTRWLNYTLAPESEFSGLQQPLQHQAKQRRQALGELVVFRQRAALRRKASALYHSSQVETLVTKVHRAIESKQLAIRDDVQIFEDIGTASKVVQLLMTYHPAWLRVGLETVYGESLGITASEDEEKTMLAKFLRTRFLYDEATASKFGEHTIGKQILQGEMRKAVHLYTLDKFLSLVLFLDVAKQTRVLPSDPVLFAGALSAGGQRAGAIRSSRDMIVAFSREYLKGEGDVMRHLAFLGYLVSYEQAAIDEYDYTVRNLATDLRDGVRLAKLVEVLTDNRTLVRRMKLPAEERAKQLANVYEVFKALQEAGLVIKRFACEPCDIVDGHREKTIALLWRIMMHWKLPSLLDTESLRAEVQRIRKLQDPDGTNERRLSAQNRAKDMETKLYGSDEKLQTLLDWTKAICANYGIPVSNFTSSFADGRALCLLINYYLPGLLPLEEIHTNEPFEPVNMLKHTQTLFEGSKGFAATFSPTQLMQRRLKDVRANQTANFRLVASKIKELGGIPQLLRTIDVDNEAPDEKLVIAFTSYLCSRLLDIRTEVAAASKVQDLWRRKIGVRRETARRIAATRMQTLFRGAQQRKSFLRLRGAAVTLQRFGRGRIARNLASKLRIARAAQESESAARVAAAEVITRRARTHLLSTGFQSLRRTTIGLQSRARGIKARREYLALRNATIEGQAQIRGFLARRHFVTARHAANRIRAAVLGHAARKEFITLKRAAVSVQSSWRSVQCQRELVQLRKDAQSELEFRQLTLRVLAQDASAVFAAQQHRREVLSQLASEAQHFVEEREREFHEEKLYYLRRLANEACDYLLLREIQERMLHQMRLNTLHTLASEAQDFVAERNMRRATLAELARHAAEVVEMKERKAQWARVKTLFELAHEAQSAVYARDVHRGKQRTLAYQAMLYGQIRAGIRHKEQLSVLRGVATEAQRAVERKELVRKQTRAAVAIQSLFRGFVGRRIADEVSQQRQYELGALWAIAEEAKQVFYTRGFKKAIFKLLADEAAGYVAEMEQVRHEEQLDVLRTLAQEAVGEVVFREFKTVMLHDIAHEAAIYVAYRDEKLAELRQLAHEAQDFVQIKNGQKQTLRTVAYDAMNQLAFTNYKRALAKYLVEKTSEAVAEKREHLAVLKTLATEAVQSVLLHGAKVAAFGAVAQEAVQFVIMRTAKIATAKQLAAEAVQAVGEKREHLAVLKGLAGDAASFVAVRTTKLAALRAVAEQASVYVAQHNAKLALVKQLAGEVVQAVTVKREHVAVLKNLAGAAVQHVAFRDSVRSMLRAVATLAVQAVTEKHEHAVVRKTLAGEAAQFVAVRNAKLVVLKALAIEAVQAVVLHDAHLGLLHVLATEAVQFVTRRDSQHAVLKGLAGDAVRAVVLRQAKHAMLSALASEAARAVAEKTEHLATLRLLAQEAVVAVGTHNAKLAALRGLAGEAVISAVLRESKHAIKRELAADAAKAVAERNVKRSVLQTLASQAQEFVSFRDMRLAALKTLAEQVVRVVEEKERLILEANKVVLRQLALDAVHAVEFKGQVRTLGAIAREATAFVAARGEKLAVLRFLAQEIVKAVELKEQKHHELRVAVLRELAREAVGHVVFHTQKVDALRTLAGEAVRAVERKEQAFHMQRVSKLRELADEISRVVTFKGQLRLLNAVASEASQVLGSRIAMREAREAARAVLSEAAKRAETLRVTGAAVLLQSLVRRKQAVRMAAALRVELDAAAQAERARVQGEREAEAVCTIQRVVRGFLGRRAAMWRKRGIVSIQSLIRAYLVRLHDDKKKKALRARIARINAEALPSQTLGQRTNNALTILLSHSQLSVVLKACQSLDVSTRFSEVCCQRMISYDAVSTVVGLISNCNRSQPHLELMKHALNVLLHLASYDSTLARVASCPKLIPSIMGQLPSLMSHSELFIRAVELLNLCTVAPGFARQLKDTHGSHAFLKTTAAGFDNRLKRARATRDEAQLLAVVGPIKTLLETLDQLKP